MVRKRQKSQNTIWLMLACDYFYNVQGKERPANWDAEQSRSLLTDTHEAEKQALQGWFRDRMLMWLSKLSKRKQKEI